MINLSWRDTVSIEIVSFDPGTTTGVATLNNNDYRTFQIRPDLYPHPHETLYDMLSELKPKVVAYEAFHFRQNKTGAIFTGVEYIGVIELWAQMNYAEIVKISPGDGKGFWNDNKIKAIDLYKPAHPHAMDALRILLRYQMKTDKAFMDRVLPILKERL